MKIYLQNTVALVILVGLFSNFAIKSSDAGNCYITGSKQCSEEYNPNTQTVCLQKGEPQSGYNPQPCSSFTQAVLFPVGHEEAYSQSEHDGYSGTEASNPLTACYRQSSCYKDESDP
jgi:hypothetical protein